MAWSSPRTWTTGEVVTAAHMNQEVRDNFLAAFPNQMNVLDWDPSLEATTTNPSVSVDGARSRVGPEERLWAKFTFSDIAAPYGDGTYFVTLPNNATNILSSATFASGQVVGTYQARDNSVPNGFEGSVALRSASTIHFNAPSSGLLNSGGPIIWAAFDVLSFEARIPVA
jgi:hypothetical protein